MDSIAETKKQNSVVAFKATGICPLDRNQVLKRIPGAGPATPSRERVYSQVSEVFVERLEEQRYGQQGAPRRGKRLQVSPGKSWGGAVGACNSGEESNSDDPDPDLGESENEGGSETRQARAKTPEQRRGSEEIVQNIEPKPGDFVLVKVTGKRAVKFAVSQVDHVDQNLELVIKFLKPDLDKKVFLWPQPQIIKSHDYSDIQEILGEPKKLKKKGAPLRFVLDFNKFNIF